MAARVILSVGTKRGLFLLESNKGRRKWKISDPYLKGWPIDHAMIDTRSTPRLHVCATSYVYGWNVFSGPVSRADKLKPAEHPPQPPKLPARAAKFAKKYGIPTSPKAWIVEPGTAKRKKVLYCGTAPAGLFRSADSGKSWEPVEALNSHKSRKDWSPGAGGMSLHSIQIDPDDENRMWVGISAAGALRTEDGGATWTPINKAVARYVGAPEASQVGT